MGAARLVTSWCPSAWHLDGPLLSTHAHLDYRGDPSDCGQVTGKPKVIRRRMLHRIGGFWPVDVKLPGSRHRGHAPCVGLDQSRRTPRAGFLAVGRNVGMLGLALWRNRSALVAKDRGIVDLQGPAWISKQYTVTHDLCGSSLSTALHQVFNGNVFDFEQYVSRMERPTEVHIIQ